MKDIIKTILYEWREEKLPTVLPRKIDLTTYLKLKVRKIVVVTGFRRSGKTFLIFSLIKKLLKKKNRENVIYINFEDERIPPKTEFLTQLLSTIKETFGHPPEFLFLDELPAIPNWNQWLRRIYDKERINLFVTGSSSKISSEEIPTGLRGRCLEEKIYPLSFGEFLNFKDIKVDFKNLDYLENQRAKVMKGLDEYLYFGGMPEVVLMDKTKKKELLRQYFSAVVRRDIAERFKIKNKEGLRSLLQLLLNSTSFSINRLCNNLKSTGLKIGKTTISRYISYIENSYFMESVPIFSYKIKDQMRLSRKNYFIDNGFINTLSLKFSKDFGRLYENLVFWELKRRFEGSEIFYWRDEKQREIDFVIKKGLRPELLIQVCYDIGDFETKKRELLSLIKASDKLNCKNLLIITQDFENEEKIKGKIIKFVPLWKWLTSYLR